MQHVKLLLCYLLEGSLTERSLSSWSMTGMLDLSPCKSFLILFTYKDINSEQQCRVVFEFWILKLMSCIPFESRLLAAKYRPYGVYKDARSILIIHNLAHQVRSL